MNWFSFLFFIMIQKWMSDSWFEDKQPPSARAAKAVPHNSRVCCSVWNLAENSWHKARGENRLSLQAIHGENSCVPVSCGRQQGAGATNNKHV